MEVKHILESYKNLLQKENSLLIKSLQDSAISQELLEVVEKKEDLLKQILGLDPGAVEGFEEELATIDMWMERNRILAIENIEFVNEIFDAIYAKNSSTQYTKDGTIYNKKEHIFNKKA